MQKMELTIKRSKKGIYRQAKDDTNWLDREVGRSFDQWMQQTLHDDTGGCYVAFSLNTRYSQQAFTDRISERCSNRQFFYVLPATSWGGRVHYHGLIRFPATRLEPTNRWVSAEINEDGNALPIWVPLVLKELAWNAKTKNTGSTFGDLHLRNDGTHVELLTSGSCVAASVLDYWQKTSDGEVRDFSSGDFFPYDNRRAVKVRTGRPPKPRVARHAPIPFLNIRQRMEN